MGLYNKYKTQIQLNRHIKYDMLLSSLNSDSLGSFDIEVDDRDGMSGATRSKGVKWRSLRFPGCYVSYRDASCRVKWLDINIQLIERVKSNQTYAHLYARMLTLVYLVREQLIRQSCNILRYTKTHPSYA